MKLPTHLAGPLGFLILTASLSSVFAEPPTPKVPALAKSNNTKKKLDTPDIKKNRTIVVEPRSVEELKLNKSTTLALGEGAQINLNKIPNPDSQTNVATVVSLEKGPFRLISSSVDKKDIKIRTPNLLLSVEASVLDLYIAPNGAEYLLLHAGSAKVCKKSNNTLSSCRILQSPCDLIRVSPGGKISQSLAWGDRTTELELTFSETFPFILTPPQSDPIVYHSRLGVEENKCGPTSIANKKSSPQKVYETGALPEPEKPEKTSPSIEKNNTTEIINDEPKSKTDQNTSAQQKYETGALPEPALLTKKPSIEKNKTIKKISQDKNSLSSGQHQSNNRICAQCINDEKADKYWTKIIRQTQNHISTWWNSVNQPKNNKKT